MKKLLLLLFILAPTLAISQVDLKKVKLSEGVQDSVLGTSLVLKDNSVIFQKVYTSDLSTEELLQKVSLFLPSIKAFQLTESPNQSSNQFSGKLSEFTVNYRKYGGTLMGTTMVLNYPINANVIIQVKENKYRVTVSDIIFKNVSLALSNSSIDYLFDDLMTKNKRQKIRTHPASTSAAKYLDKDLSSSFDITQVRKLSADF